MDEETEQRGRARDRARGRGGQNGEERGRRERIELFTCAKLCLEVQRRPEAAQRARTHDGDAGKGKRTQMRS